MADTQYLGNPNLKKTNVPVQFSREQVMEFIKCKEDPIYFALNYIKIVSLDHGVIPFKLYDFQQDLIKSFHEKRFTICKMPRQTGKSTTCVAFLLHYLIFNDNVTIGILANKASTAREILGRLQLAYENLPQWMQHGIISWNKGSVELENGSTILAASTSASAVRGMSFNIIFLDEFAFVQNNIADAFFASVYPTITSGKSTKVIIVSTPHGMNHFYRMWHDAEKGKSDYNPIEVHWSQVPGRDDVWKETTIKNTSEEQFKVEFECEFIGSVDTLISPMALRSMEYRNPDTSSEGFDVYYPPEEGHRYMVTADVARGVGKDYSAFVVFDTTEFPYKVVAKYKDNEIKPMVFPGVINKVAKSYNMAHVLIEVNDIGDQVASILNYDLEYPNVMMCAMRGRAGQQLGSGFSGSKTQLGVKMSVATKKLGCSNLKALVEERKLTFEDFNIVQELTTFISRNNSYAAEDGCNDDLAMCMVIFSWAVAQDFFREMTDNDVRKAIYDEKENQIEQDMAPFGFMNDGTEDETFVDGNGDVWSTVGNSSGSAGVDEYGTMNYMWDYM